MHYLILCEHAVNTQETRRSVNAAHQEYLKQLQTQSGVYYTNEVEQTQDNPAGTLIIAPFASLNDARAWAAADPFTTAEVYARINVFPYKEFKNE